MRKIYFTMLLAFSALLLSAQSVSLTVGGDTTSLLGSNSNQTAYFSEFDKDNKDRNIVKEGDGFYYYSYDWCCRKVKLFDDKYWVKIFLGKTYEEALTSFNTIIKWYKKAEKGEYVTFENPDGQRILIYKREWPYSSLITYGTLEDIQWNIMLLEMQTRGLFYTIDVSESAVYTNLQTRMEEGKYHLTGLDLSMCRTTLKKFKKKYKKQYENKQ